MPLRKFTDSTSKYSMNLLHEEKIAEMTGFRQTCGSE